MEEMQQLKGEPKKDTRENFQSSASGTAAPSNDQLYSTSMRANKRERLFSTPRVFSSLI